MLFINFLCSSLVNYIKELKYIIWIKWSANMTVILCHKCHFNMHFKMLKTFQDIWNNGFFTCHLVFLYAVSTLMIFMSWEGQVNKNTKFNSYAKRHSHSEYRNRERPIITIVPHKKQQKKPRYIIFFW